MEYWNSLLRRIIFYRSIKLVCVQVFQQSSPYKGKYWEESIHIGCSIYLIDVFITLGNPLRVLRGKVGVRGGWEESGTTSELIYCLAKGKSVSFPLVRCPERIHYITVVVMNNCVVPKYISLTTWQVFIIQFLLLSYELFNAYWQVVLLLFIYCRLIIYICKDTSMQLRFNA